MPYLFVSHASADNPRLKPIIQEAIAHGLSVWFDRPYDLGLRTNDFAGYIRDGEPWTMEILQALVNASGIVCFPSEATTRSDECRLELALGRVFGAVSDFKIFPVLLDETSFRFLDHRVAQTQGRKIIVEVGDTNAFRLASGAREMMIEFFLKLRDHVQRFEAKGGLLQSLYFKFLNVERVMSAPPSQPMTVHTPESPQFAALVVAYRRAEDSQARRSLDNQATSSRRYPLIEALSQVLATSDEAVGLAGAMSLAGSHPADQPQTVALLASELLKSRSERVRFRVGDALFRRVISRLVGPQERNDVLCVLEAGISREQNGEVVRALLRARSAAAAI